MWSMQKSDIKVSADSHLKIIEKMLEDIKYGSLTIIIQDGKIIQIDKVERHRIV